MRAACEWCGAFDEIEEHHIAQGCNRKAALGNAACIIWPCVRCHRTIQGIRDTRSIGLAILDIRRHHDYDLEAFYDVTGRNFPDAEDIEIWKRRLNMGATQ